MIDLVELKALVEQAERDNDFADVLQDKAFLLARQVLALSDEVERLKADFNDCNHERSRWKDRAEAAESEAQALRERMGEIERRAVTVCNEQHANADEHAARQAYALALHDIAALSTTPTKDPAP